jgi:putative transposase
MPARKDKFIGGQYYHVYNRGVNKGLVFNSEDNYRYCIQLLKKGLIDTEIGVVAFCLMPNHYHLLIRQEGAVPADHRLGVVFNAYVQALNKQIGRTGALFEGRFKSIHIDKNEYLVHLCR